MKPRRPTPPQSPDPLRAAHVSAVAETEKSQAKYNSTLRAKDSTEQAVAGLQSECAAPLDAMDATAVARRVAQERQIELLVIKIASLEEQLVRLALDLKGALLRAADTQRDFLQPVHAALVDEIASALSPHFRAPGRARQVAAAETDSVRSLVRVMTAYWVGDAAFDPVNTASREVPQMRAILDGKQPWLTGT